MVIIFLAKLIFPYCLPPSEQESFEEPKMDLIGSLPNEVAAQVFSYLNSTQIGSSLLVNWQWNLLVSADLERLWQKLHLRIAFGKQHWKKYLGEDVGEEPSLPKKIYEILRNPCPFWPGKKVEETHVLVLIPENIIRTKIIDEKSVPYQEPFDLTQLGQFMKKEFVTPFATNKYGNSLVAKSHWVLMPKSVIPGSTNKSFIKQQKLIQEKSKQIGIEYTTPKVLDIAICIFAEYLRSGKYLFKNTYTNCQETVGGYDRVLIGEFCSKGLSIITESSNNEMNNFNDFVHELYIPGMGGFYDSLTSFSSNNSISNIGIAPVVEFYENPKNPVL